MECRSRICRKEFDKRKLRCPHCDAVGVDKLYKYRGFNARTLLILSTQQVYFPTAHRLNDPFEFDFQLLGNAVGGIKIDQDSLREAKAAMKNYGVFSLSEPNNNILMWSHYADEHRGLCLEFERTDSNDLGNPDHCIPVIYDDELPAFKAEDLTTPGSISKILTAKGRFWDYELEWRIISRDGNKEFPFPGDLTGVIFGFRMPEPQRDLVRSILGTTVQYYETSRSSRYYALGVDALP